MTVYYMQDQSLDKHSHVKSKQLRIVSPFTTKSSLHNSSDMAELYL